MNKIDILYDEIWHAYRILDNFLDTEDPEWDDLTTLRDWLDIVLCQRQVEETVDKSDCNV